MSESTQAESTQTDKWHSWLLERRFAGDAKRKEASQAFYNWVASEVVTNAAIQPGETLLDVGAGEGLIAFSALDSIGSDGRIIISDISQPLLDHCKTVVADCGFDCNFEFVNAAAEDLSAIDDESVDIVTTRSVLIYVDDKQKAFNEFYRVLRKGGRASLFEPINRFRAEQRGECEYFGYDLNPIKHLADRVLAVGRTGDLSERLRTDAMLNFDERDLIQLALDAGFDRVDLEYRATITEDSDRPGDWHGTFQVPPNPNAMSLEERARQALTEDELKEFVDFLRPLVESSTPRQYRALSFLVARKLK
jgi:ubiquinone/menaquinone biosynthesis C-methylase UbiE